jgi:hypothetical protein
MFILNYYNFHKKCPLRRPGDENEFIREHY